MHTNPFNPAAYYGAVPFQRRLSSSDALRRPPRGVGANASSRCGLKGKMALGDAHPYLALFYLKFFGEFSVVL